MIDYVVAAPRAPGILRGVRCIYLVWKFLEKRTRGINWTITKTPTRQVKERSVKTNCLVASALLASDLSNELAIVCIYMQNKKTERVAPRLVRASTITVYFLPTSHVLCTNKCNVLEIKHGLVVFSALYNPEAEWLILNQLQATNLALPSTRLTEVSRNMRNSLRRLSRDTSLQPMVDSNSPTPTWSWYSSKLSLL